MSLLTSTIKGNADLIIEEISLALMDSGPLGDRIKFVHKNGSKSFWSYPTVVIRNEELKRVYLELQK